MVENIQQDIKELVKAKTPRQTFAERLKLREYFSYPSTQGFSAYRTGVAVHVILFVLVGAGMMKGLITWTSCPLWCAVIAAGAVLFLLWGIGVFVGIVSHYSPLISLGVLAGLFVVLFRFPEAMGAVMLVSMGINLVLFPMMKVLSVMLNRKQTP